MMPTRQIRLFSAAVDRRSRADRRFPPRRGFSLLEVQFAFAVLGIGLAGLCPLVVMQLRQVRVLEKRLQGQVVQYNATNGTSTTMLSANTYYIVPWQNPLAQKITGSAQIVLSTIPCDPGSLALPTPAPASFPVSIAELDVPATGQDMMVFKIGVAPVLRSTSSQNVTAYVDVSAP
jgi:type II secretory pathway pseudopilin PulG